MSNTEKWFMAIMFLNLFFLSVFVNIKVDRLLEKIEKRNCVQIDVEK